MKKKVSILFIIGAVGFSSCKKEELIPSNNKKLINGIEKQLCTGCGGGSWDIQGEGSSTEASTLKLSPTDSTSVKNSRKPVTPIGRNN
ncbi:MAG: hypothetical protein WC220_09995 [Pedobacter sp.]|jgi:hypothetical protein